MGEPPHTPHSQRISVASPPTVGLEPQSTDFWAMGVSTFQQLAAAGAQPVELLQPSDVRPSDAGFRAEELVEKLRHRQMKRESRNAAATTAEHLDIGGTQMLASPLHAPDMPMSANAINQMMSRRRKGTDGTVKRSDKETLTDDERRALCEFCRQKGLRGAGKSTINAITEKVLLLLRAPDRGVQPTKEERSLLDGNTTQKSKRWVQEVTAEAWAQELETAAAKVSAHPAEAWWPPRYTRHRSICILGGRVRRQSSRISTGCVALAGSPNERRRPRVGRHGKGCRFGTCEASLCRWATAGLESAWDG